MSSRLSHVDLSIQQVVIERHAPFRPAYVERAAGRRTAAGLASQLSCALVIREVALGE